MQTIIDIDGNEFRYSPKRLQYREYAKLVGCIEAITAATKKSELSEPIDQGLAICLDHFDVENNRIDVPMAMEIFQQTIATNNNSELIRKKSE